MPVGYGDGGPLGAGQFVGSSLIPMITTANNTNMHAASTMNTKIPYGMLYCQKSFFKGR